MTTQIAATGVFWTAPDQALFTEQVIAAVLGCSVSKLQADRWRGRGIKFVRIGSLVRYQKSDVLDALREAKQLTAESVQRVAA